MTSATQIGWIGLGGMGTQMAAHLHNLLKREGGALHVHNRTQAKLDDFAAAHPGSIPAAHPKELATACSITFSCLSNDDALKSVVHGFLEGRSRDAADSASQPCVYVDCSTVLPTTTHYLAALASEHNVIYCHCPVFGRPDAAAAGALMAVLAGGNEEVRQGVAALVKNSFAQKGAVVLGDDPAAASGMKLVGNMAILGQIELAAECLALGEKAGLPQEELLHVLGYISSGPIPIGYAKRIAHGDYAAGAGFTVDLGLKDAGHMRELSRSLACPAPIVDIAHAHLLSAKAKGRGHLDWGAVGLSVRDAGGLPDNSSSAS